MVIGSLKLSHIQIQVLFDLVVLKVVTTLICCPTLQTLRNLLKVLAIPFQAFNVGLLLLERPLIRARIRSG